MQKFQEDIAFDMYRNYGIAEWNEKCDLLTREDHIQLLKDIENGMDSGIIEKMRLPFPKFVEAYFKNCPTFDTYFSDPTAAYKLYLLSSKGRKFFAEKMRYPILSDSAIANLLDIINIKDCKHQISYILYSKFEDLNISTSVAEVSKTQMRKYAYLTQYIDLEESIRLGLSISKGLDIEDETTSKTSLKVHYVFDLEGKLNMLNPVYRIIVVLYLGLYGHHMHNAKEIAEKLSINKDTIKRAIITIFPFISQSLYLFEKSIGFSLEKQDSYCKFFYKNKKFRTIDMTLERQYYYASLSDDIKLLLSSYPETLVNIYLSSKAQYSNSSILAQYSSLTPSKLNAVLEDFQHKGL